MRKLIYIPIIHTEADMGSLAAALEPSTAALCGRERWTKHKVTAVKFWQMMADYLAGLDVSSLKVYQDGLVADGDLGKKIIAEGARQGSQNYATILNLLERGATLVSTEDRALVEEEYGHLKRILTAQTLAQRKLADQEYKARKGPLVVARDGFIAHTINETLEKGEVGLLFLGAYHNVISYLAPDIVVEPLKEPKKVKAYFDELISGGDEKHLKQLTDYLTSDVTTGVS